MNYKKRDAWGWLAAMAIGLAPLSVQAQQQYISDKLVVNVYAEANQESTKLATLESGDAVESLEKADTYTRIRLTDGREGWIKSSYLTSQPPATVRLKELEKERGASATTPDAQLAQELKQAKEHNAALQSEIATLKQNAQQSAPAVAPPAAAAPEPVGVLQGPQESTGHSTLPLHYWSVPAIALVAGAIGYLFGYRTLARRIRRKYGNVKIY